MKIDVKIEKEKIQGLINKRSSLLNPKKKMIQIDLMYMPYYVFEFSIELKGSKTVDKTVCVDCLSGEHAFLKNVELPKNKIEKSDEDRFSVNMDDAEKISRIALMSTLLYERKKGIAINQIITKEKSIMEYPYWIGYYRRKKKLDFEAVDAVSGSLQGAKMKPTFIKLIMQ